VHTCAKNTTFQWSREVRVTNKRHALHFHTVLFVSVEASNNGRCFLSVVDIYLLPICSVHITLTIQSTDNTNA